MQGTSGFLTRVALVGGLFVWAGLAAAAASAELAACDGAPSRVLVAPPAGAPRVWAEAMWVDASTLRWPRTSVEGRFRLYHSASGRIELDAGAPVHGADGALGLRVRHDALAPAAEARVRWAGDGVTLALEAADHKRLPALLRGQLVLVQEDADGRVRSHTLVQQAAALDTLYAAAEGLDDLGATPQPEGGTGFRVWAPTARSVSLCLQRDARSAAHARLPMRRDARTGSFHLRRPGDLTGQYYSYLVEVFVPGAGWVRNRVTDPYALSLNADSARSWIGRLDGAAVTPPGWAADRAPATVAAAVDMSIYELHVRDFSRDDASVRAPWRGKYLAFTEANSHGMRHLRALAEAGLTDLHLLPVFDLASVPERGCVAPVVEGRPDGPEQQAAIARVKDSDCYNWGYDPWHFTAPEGSFATDADDGALRVREFRQMVMALHAAGLRVGMDVVYNHTTASGQHPKSVLDRIVPGYYHRLNGRGEVERSTCCDNTATEHLMMGKLMLDSVLTWATAYHIDSFRFDLMAHQPRALMLQMKQRLRAATGREIQLLGEGWNFGEVADGTRFVQASQLELNGSGIGTFSDRARDAVRGGGAGDGGDAQIARQGYVNGLVYDPNPLAAGRAGADELLRAADLVRVGLAGSLRSYTMQTRDGSRKTLAHVDYGGQPAGYVAQPGEVVNYVENHDNQTLYDVNVFKLPPGTSTGDRARVQMLAAAINMFSQGIAYFHAGIDTLRSKSMDRNSYDSGDWFNRLDWTYRSNFFGTGLPPAWDNEASWPLMRPLLADPANVPRAEDIAWARDQFRDLLRLRASSTLFRLRSADEVAARLRLHNTGPDQLPTVLAGELDGRGHDGAGFQSLLYLINVDKVAHTLTLDALKGRDYRLHPVHRSPKAADRRAAEDTRYERASGRFLLPPRTAVVHVVE